MRILDRYIFKSVLGLFLACIFIFMFLYVIIDILARLEDILALKVPFEILIRFYLTNLPAIFLQVSPFAGLIATLYTFGKLNRENEIMAMRASGISVYQISKTVIIFGLICSVFAFWINNIVLPKALNENQKYKEKIERNMNKAKEKALGVINNLAVYGLKNRLIFITKFSLATNTMEGITILQHDEHQNLTKKIVANTGAFKDGAWTFRQCITYEFDLSGQIKNEPQFLDEEIMDIPETPRDFLSQKQSPDLMTAAQLNNYIWKLSKSGATGVIKNLKIDLYNKFTAPLTNFIIILLGIPFAFKMKKRAMGMASLGLSLFAGFLYYILGAICLALGKAGVLSPLLATSLSHITAFLTGIYLISILH